MTPAAHLQAAILLLGDIDSLARPADAIISAWFRTQRGIEDRDRAAVLDLVYGGFGTVRGLAGGWPGMGARTLLATGCWRG